MPHLDTNPTWNVNGLESPGSYYVLGKGMGKVQKGFPRGPSDKEPTCQCRFDLLNWEDSLE